MGLLLSPGFTPGPYQNHKGLSALRGFMFLRLLRKFSFPRSCRSLNAQVGMVGILEHSLEAGFGLGLGKGHENTRETGKHGRIQEELRPAVLGEITA